MDPLTQEIADTAFKKIANFHSEKPFALQDLMLGEPVWEAAYRKHPAAGRVFYNRLEARNFTLPDGRKIKPLRGGKLQQYEFQGGTILAAPGQQGGGSAEGNT